MKFYDADTNEEVRVDSIGRGLGGIKLSYLNKKGFLNPKRVIEFNHDPQMEFRYGSMLITGFQKIVDDEGEPLQWHLTTVELVTRKKNKK
jgi:hypothetical protein